MKVKDLLAEKDSKVHTIDVDATVEDAINEMAAKHISALIVMDGDRPVGIFTERDVLKTHLKHRDKAFTDIPVREGMTNKLIVAQLDDDLNMSMSTMIQADIRHLPVVSEGKVVGMLSIRDIMQQHVQHVGSLKAELTYLQDYISRLEDAKHD